MLRGIYNIGILAGSATGVEYNPYLAAVITRAIADGVALPDAATLLKISNVLDAIGAEMAEIKQLFITKYSGADTFKKYNLANPNNSYIATNVTYTANGTNGGASGYIDTNLQLNVAGIANNNHSIVVMTVGALATGDYREFGLFKSTTPTAKTEMYPYSAVRATNFLPIQSGPSNFYTFTRTTSTGKNVYHLKVDGTSYTCCENGTLKLTQTIALATLPALSMYIHAQNNNGTAIKKSPNTIGAYILATKNITPATINTALQLL
jgi:hypothetical protein